MMKHQEQAKRVLISAERIEEAVFGLAERVSAWYADTDEVLGLVLLEGARRFAAELKEKLSFELETEFVRASSYFGGTSSGGRVQFEIFPAIREKIRGRQVLVIDDIYDSGHTLAAVLKGVNACGPAGVKTCVLLEKNIQHAREVKIDFLGLQIEDVFVVGYGLDHDGRHRDLPYIASLGK